MKKIKEKLKETKIISGSSDTKVIAYIFETLKSFRLTYIEYQDQPVINGQRKVISEPKYL